MSAKDEWIRAAMKDESMVAELLIRLNQAHASQPGGILPPLSWGLRQPRSLPVLRCNAVSSRKDVEPTRCSPTTPLSWSDGTGSLSCTADGFEASSRLKDSSAVARSKTFAELKEQENILLKERIYINKELATLRATFKEQTSRNECLKRLKVEYNLQYPRKTMAASDEHKQAYSYYARQMEESTFNDAHLLLPTHLRFEKVPQSDSFQVQKVDATQQRYFMLPDLNTTPSENDSSETLYGMS